MRLAVFSDAHGNGDRISQVMKELSNVDYLLYAGDKIEDLKQADISPRIEIIAVKGNRDFGVDSPQEQIVIIADKKIFLTHGDKYGIKWGLDKLYYKAQEVGADIVIFGHTHYRYARKEKEVLFFNPGSISLPRDGKPPSYGLIQINNQKIDYQHCDFE